MRTSICYSLCLFVLVCLLCAQCVVCQKPTSDFDYPVGNLSTTWINNNVSIPNPRNVGYYDGSRVRVLLVVGSVGSTFACGFVCFNPCADGYLFAVLIVQTDSGSRIVHTATISPQLVWAANRNHLVGEDAALELTANGNLLLRNGDGSVVWSTNTGGKGVGGIELRESGNLVLFAHNSNQTFVWQSFDYPTDTLVLGQTLKVGQKLVCNVSSGDPSEGPYYLSIMQNGLVLFANAPEPQPYYTNLISSNVKRRDSPYAQYNNGSLDIYVSERRDPDASIPLTPVISFNGKYEEPLRDQYLRLDSDGHLRVYQISPGFNWQPISDPLSSSLQACDYPSTCGDYGICDFGKCSCPTAFTETDSKAFNCSPPTPLQCSNRSKSTEQYLVDLDEVSYFIFDKVGYNFTATKQQCKQSCLENCSCAAAFYQRNDGQSTETCYHVSKVYSLRKNFVTNHFSSVAYLKVENSTAQTTAARARNSNGRGKVAGIVTGSVVASAFVVLFLAVALWRRTGKKPWEGYDTEDDEPFEAVPGLPLRFSYDELRTATDDFGKKLGAGGFGSVYEGILDDGTKVAVKRLDKAGQGKKEFRAEVVTIGSIHHVNLVRLRGFCAERSHRLLVYEHLANGSLDKWLFSKKKPLFFLDWQSRLKIAIHTAKGLCYLHEECHERIIHLDIKPQNILLDEHLNAKVSDFGLSRLMDRDQSQVVTTMRGTPGYLAPEWLNSKVTEKADVYSFGVMLLEIVSGRKNLDSSSWDNHLLDLLPQKAREGNLLDVVDEELDGNLDREEAERVLRVGMWCVQRDFSVRPPMSVVVKMLEGVFHVEDPPTFDFGFNDRFRPSTRKTDRLEAEEASMLSYVPVASTLSAPR